MHVSAFTCITLIGFLIFLKKKKVFVLYSYSNDSGLYFCILNSIYALLNVCTGLPDSSILWNWFCGYIVRLFNPSIRSYVCNHDCTLCLFAPAHLLISNGGTNPFSRYFRYFFRHSFFVVVIDTVELDNGSHVCIDKSRVSFKKNYCK